MFNLKKKYVWYTTVKPVWTKPFPDYRTWSVSIGVRSSRFKLHLNWHNGATEHVWCSPVCGLFMVRFWQLSGLFMVRFEQVSELFMVRFWQLSGLFMIRLKQISGLFMVRFTQVYLYLRKVLSVATLRIIRFAFSGL